MKNIIAIFLLLAIHPLSARIKPETYIINQTGCPIQIIKYKAGAFTTTGIQHEVELKNLSDTTIVAVQFGFISYDIWNQYLHTGYGYMIEDIKPDKIDPRKAYPYKGTWTFLCYGDNSFQTGYVYVSKIRFENNIFWSADNDKIVEEFQKIEQSFKVEYLNDKGSKP
jgi:hypothetical protein